MNRKYKLLLFLAPITIIIDQLVKIYVDNNMYLHQSIEVLENFFHITYIRNKGAAFGLLSGVDASVRIPFFLIMSTIAIGVILYILKKEEGKSILFPSALSLILGGATGNLIDRIRMGEVIDYIYVHWYEYYWPAFNVADAAISIGMVLLIIHMFKERKKEDVSDNL